MLAPNLFEFLNQLRRVSMLLLSWLFNFSCNHDRSCFFHQYLWLNLNHFLHLLLTLNEENILSFFAFPLKFNLSFTGSELQKQWLDLFISFTYIRQYLLFFIFDKIGCSAYHLSHIFLDLHNSIVDSILKVKIQLLLQVSAFKKDMLDVFAVIDLLLAESRQAFLELLTSVINSTFHHLCLFLQ